MATEQVHVSIKQHLHCLLAVGTLMNIPAFPPCHDLFVYSWPSQRSVSFVIPQHDSHCSNNEKQQLEQGIATRMTEEFVRRAGPSASATIYAQIRVKLGTY